MTFAASFQQVGLAYTTVGKSGFITSMYIILVPVFGLFFQTLTPEQRASIRVVAGDGARWIDSCVHEWCPNAERAPDGFHIVSWTSGAPDNPRKQQKPLFCAIP